MIKAILPLSLLAATLFALSFAGPKSDPTFALTDGKTASAAERGKYLVHSFGCADCHTPFKLGANGPEPDATRMFSGHPEGLVMPPAPKLPEGPWLVTASATNTAWAGPWGVSFTSNLTPDKETGIGAWSEQDFLDTVRSARHQGRGRPILPPMPIEALANMTDEDLRSIYAYLRTVPAIRNRVPEPVAPPEAR